MRPTIVLMVVVCWSTACTIAAAQTQCVSDTIDGVNKHRAVEKSLKSLDEQIEKWKADNGVTGPVTVTARKSHSHIPLAKLRSISCITSTRCRERLCVHDLLDRCGVARGLHLRCPAVCW
jgi:hypothetical protein